MRHAPPPPPVPLPTPTPQPTPAHNTPRANHTIPPPPTQVEYVTQAVLRLRQDERSEVRERMASTTKFVSGGVQLVSALWSQDAHGVFDALVNLRQLAQDTKSKQRQPWCVVHRESLPSISVSLCRLAICVPRFPTVFLGPM
jgi:hypothetical protein